jgi:hypothetical protein
MTRPFGWATAMAFLALASLSVYAADPEVPDASGVPAASGVVQLPDFVPSDEDFYPASAARKLLQGSVGFELQIDDQGRVQLLSQTFADHPDFAPDAAGFLKSGRFRVAPGWVQSGGPDQRFVVEVQFSVARGGGSCTKRPPHVADTEVFVVCRSLPNRRGGRL